MANEGTLEFLARQVAVALSPLEQRLAANGFVGLMEELGLSPPSSVANAAGVTTEGAIVVSTVAALPAAIAELETAVTTEDTGKIITAGSNLLRKIVEVFRSIEELASAIQSSASTLSVADRTKVEAFAAVLPRRLFDFIIIEYIRQAQPSALDVLTLLGLVDDELVEATAGDPLSRPSHTRQLHFERLLTLATAPAQHIENAFGWGSPGFDGHGLFQRIQTFITNYGMPAVLIEPPGQPPILEAFILRMQANNAVNPPGLTIHLRFPAIEDFEREYQMATHGAMLVSTSARFETGLDIELRPPFDVRFVPSNGNAEIEVSTGFAVQDPTGPMLLLGQPGGSGLFLDRFSAEAGLKGNWSVGSNVRIEPTFAAALNGGRLKIDFSESDGFLQSIAGGVQIDANFDTGIRWSPSEGVSFEGSSAIEIALPLHLSIGPLEVQTLYLIAGIDSDGNISLELSSGFSTKLGPLAASVDRFGLKVTFSFPEDGKGNLGRGNVDFALKPPNGIGLSIDAGAVKGGGYLFIDADRGEYAGALELRILDFLSVTAIGIITTKMPDGSEGFAFIAIIAVEFNPGIQLGFGFTLLGVGGLVGLNRSMNLDALAQGARSGSIDTVLFPKDVVANAPRIISDLRTFFPPEQDTFLVGPMAKFGWGTPTLISLSLGIIIEIPGNVAIVGKLTIAIPDEQLPLIIIQVAFMGAIEFDKKRGWFFATLYESRVIYMTLDGGLGVLAAFGNDSNFIVSVGGFHPAYNPPALPFPPIPRIAINILNTPVARVRVDAYFAVTSNTVQFGARAELYFGIKIASIEGHLGFDALFQFSPFYFIISISVSLSVKLFGMGFFSVRFRGSLEGPSPWHVEGTGSISILFWDIDVDFSHTWGDKEETRLPPISVMPILVAEFEKVENWTAQLANANQLLVSLRTIDAGADLVLHPAGSLKITQRAIPLGLTLDKIGNQRPDDANRFTIDAATVGIEKRGTIRESFAMAQFQDMKDGEKLSASDYENEDAGLELSITGNQTNTSFITKRIARYEQIIIDTNFKRHIRRFVTLIAGLFTHFLANNTVARAGVSAKSRDLKHLFDEKIKVHPNSYVVVSLADNAPIDGAPFSFTSRASAKEFMAAQAARDPDFAKQAHIVRPHEMGQAA